jgi:hypothetical protein
MDRIAVRFLIAGAVIVVGGISIAATGAGIGEGAGWKGALVILAGLGLMLSGWNRRHGVSPPEE